MTVLSHFHPIWPRRAAAARTLRIPGPAVSAAWLLLLCLCAGPAFAQPTNTDGQTNSSNAPATATEAETVLSNLMVQAGEFAPTNEAALTNQPEAQNVYTSRSVTVISGGSPVRMQVPVSASGGPRAESQTQSGLSSRSGAAPDRDSAHELASGPAPTNETRSGPDRSAPARPDFSGFRMIAERNIFDPNRYAHRASGPRVRPRTVEAFGLVGVMSYDKGTFAFFDGTGSEFRKVLKREDSIAGYKVARIEPDAVELAAGTNEVQLRVGMQLRREDQGPWIASAQTEPLSSSSGNSSNGSNSSSLSLSGSSPAPSTGNPATAAAGGNESDVLKRLMQRREQE